VRASVALPVWVVALFVLAIILLLIIVWSVKRRRRPNLKQVARTAGAVVESVSALVQSTPVDGNAIELVHNGAYFDRFFADLEAARSTINIETFLTKEGDVTRRLADTLIRKRKEGVEVRMLLDASGGKRFGREDMRRLHEGDCLVRKFHPYLLSNLGRFNQRTHRKIAVIDGRIGYIGGHCFVDSWLGDAEDRKHFRDISARVQGPIVNQLQSAFTDNWIEETGEVIAGESFFPPLEAEGSVKAQVVFASPMGGPSTLKLLHYIAIVMARRSITIQNPYFLPDPDAREALVDAVKRGVTVRIMIPSTDATDAKIVSHASHHHYGTLLRGGIHVFEYQKTLLHQKVFTIDGEWSSIGSTNFDDRSFEINDEVSLVVWDANIARRLESVFEDDLKDARECKLDEWSRRAAFHRLKDGAAFLLNEQL
jgi:cardiolipin synthase